ncbi:MULTISPECIES: endonuclease/exonuclease/phosphatase family protein [unclassified Brevundimonas]|uniref:endonuclease/exonuclease/phosphatase family protein n=1 Tax=unclassified Brevundimonas TaxID=2622653 RepID=UPI0025B8320A|nr:MULTISPECIES: endonuclease/exonuclease/phosphatase family protein [unclassified Brevundimonas]
MTLTQALMRLAALALLAPPGLVAVSALSRIGHRLPDLLTQFTAPALVATVVLCGLFLLLRLWDMAALGAGAAGLLFLAVWPQWAPEKGRPAGPETLTIYSANLWARNQDVAAITRSIEQADADVVMLIELGDAPAAQLDTILAAYPHRVSTPRKERPSGAARSVIASRLPLHRVRDADGQGLAALVARAETPLGPVSLIAVHMTRPWPFQHPYGQISQAQRLAGLRAGLEGSVVVAGDFNSISSGRIGRQIKAETGLIPAPARPGTWPSALPASLGITIDHVWRSPDLALVERRLGQKTGSDHRPVIVRLSRAEP